MTASDVAALVRQLRRDGYDVKLSKNSHWKVRDNGKVVTTLPNSPSDCRWRENIRAEIRRYERERDE